MRIAASRAVRAQRAARARSDVAPSARERRDDERRGRQRERAGDSRPLHHRVVRARAQHHAVHPFALVQRARRLVQRVVVARPRGAHRALPAREQRRGEPVEQPRRVIRARRRELRRAADKQRATGMLGREQDRVGDDVRIVDRRRQLRLDVHVVLRVHHEHRVDGRGLDERDRHRHVVRLELDAQRIGEALDRVLGCRIRALQRHRRVGRLAAHVDDRAAAKVALAAKMLGRDERAMHDAPVVRIEQPALVVERHRQRGAEDRHARVVDPRVEAAERLDGLRRRALDVLVAAHVGRDRDGEAAVLADLLA
ncbi:Uncharacterised protein [Burkholderia pseudomallei]|nr:Uncharacterised protein [Burkholderia pseudomallei]CAJ3095607.1 Uncharacterised protein [Burkholderia pseudomallei]